NEYENGWQLKNCQPFFVLALQETCALHEGTQLAYR
ncbi:MAG: hypothetical protein RLZZ396_82, partial [Planctomycetota bacterium]